MAAELVAAEKGAGMMIMVASRFQLTDIAIMGIILIGIIGYTIAIRYWRCRTSSATKSVTSYCMSASKGATAKYSLVNLNWNAQLEKQL